MGKQTKPKAPTKAELEAEVVVEAIEIIPVNQQSALEKFVPFDEQLKSLIAEVDSMPPITDKVSLQNAEALSKKIRKFEIAVDKTRLASTKPIRDMLDSLKGHCDGMIKTAEGKRGTVDNAINAEAIRLQKEAEAEHLRRVTLLESNGWVLNGQFYTCGSHRFMFDELDLADETQLHRWVETAQQEISRIAAEREAERKRIEEIEKREAALRAQEAEYQEFLRWKESKTAVAAPAQAGGGYTPIIDTTSPNPPQDSATAEVEPAQLPPPPPAPVQQQTIPWMQNPGGAQAAPNPLIRAEAAPNPVGGAEAAPYVVPASPVWNPPAAVLEAQQVAAINTEEELAKFRNASISWLRQQPEARLYWNLAIEGVLLRFTAEQHTKEDWVEIFKMMKR